MRHPYKHIIWVVLVFIACNGATRKQNRLQFASSPYLLEHADNPVDWYEWGEEALSKAQKENKPLIISVGYASCHWCHEMEKECFMDTAVAKLMNENFICIKVDREERPDIDNIYMDALQLISGDTGWPLNAFALPDGKPFFAGTYYPQKSWMSLLLNIIKSYKTKHTLVVTQANALLNGIAEQELSLTDTSRMTSKPQEQDYLQLYDSIYKKADLVNGGIKGAPKFPTPAFAEFLLQHYYITGNKKALEAATTTLKKIALGGIYDQAGGGFARYATDSLWRIPHFEKMLYDNGQMVSVYAHAYQLTRDKFYKDILTETLGFIETTLAAAGGGFYSSLNADTEAGEGAFYTWNNIDFKRIAGDNLLSEYYNISATGNWKPAMNILYANETPDAFALAKKIAPDAFHTKLLLAKKHLVDERNKRSKPSVDTKIITAWNGIMLKGYADAYAATGNEAYLLKAKACANFIEQKMMEADGGLKRSYKDGKALTNAFLDDYAWTALAFTRLYEVGFDEHWIILAKKLTDHAIKNFFNSQTGLFFYAEQHGVLRKTEVADDAMPSSNAVMVKLLYTLGIVFSDTSYSDRALRMYHSVAGRVKKIPGFHLGWCSYAGLLIAKPYEVAIMGKDAIVKNKDLQQHFLPTSIIMGSTGATTLPLMKDKWTDGKTMIYVCSGKVCKKPEEETAKAILQIEAGLQTF